MTASAGNLPPIERNIHRVLLDGLLAGGRVPTHEELAATDGIPVTDVPRHLAGLAAADYLALDDSGRVICLYPLSPSPTPHIVEIGECRRHAMCAIDALGMAAMLDQAVAIEGACAGCSAPIRLDIAPGTIVQVEPPETVVLARRSGDEPACETCCPFTLFACGPAHGEEVAARLPETTVVPLEEALRHGQTIFGDLLAETLPARRRRSALTSSRLQT